MKMRVLDGALHFLRSLHRLAPTAVVTQGEALIGALAAANPELRNRAYQLRRVSDSDKQGMGRAWDKLKAWILVAPSGFPAGRLWSQLVESAPELALAVSVRRHIWAILPERDPAANDGKTIANLIEPLSKQVDRAAMTTPMYLNMREELVGCPIGKTPVPAAPPPITYKSVAADVCPAGHVETAIVWLCAKCKNPASHRSHKNATIACKWWPVMARREALL